MLRRELVLVERETRFCEYARLAWLVFRVVVTCMSEQVVERSADSDIIACAVRPLFEDLLLLFAFDVAELPCLNAHSIFERKGALGGPN